MKIFAVLIFLLNLQLTAQQLVTANPSENDTCMNGDPLGVESLHNLEVGEKGKLFLVKCHCQCTLEENHLQIVRQSESGDLIPITNFIGFGVKIFQNKSKTGKVFSIVQKENEKGTTSLTESAVTFDGKELHGKYLESSKDLLADANRLKELFNQPEPAESMSASELQKKALKLYQAGKKSEAGKLVKDFIGEPPYPVDNVNVGTFNDLGFFLVEAGFFEIGAPVLKRVLSRDPNRTVAYLNYADALAGLGKNDSALVEYKQYQARMEKAGKGAKVPARVLEKLKSK